MAHLVQTTRRYRSWAGVAGLAALITASYWHIDHHALDDRPAADMPLSSLSASMRAAGFESADAAAGSFAQIASRQIDLPHPTPSR